jgi:predicted SnoaL-like aldol condensation-catalyzing enzyme
VTDIQRNKQTVVEFYELAFNAKQPEQAAEKHLGPQYIQHNRRLPTVRMRSSASLPGLPGSSLS